MNSPFLKTRVQRGASLLWLQSEDGTNRLTRACVVELAKMVRELAFEERPLVLTGSGNFFSAGADLKEIAALGGPDAYEFAQIGQELMQSLEEFPAPSYAAVNGHCFGGGFDLALACHRRIASPDAIFGHRGAALGLITGWGGTQRLPRIVGKGRALQMFVAAEQISAPHAMNMGMIDAIADDPVAEAIRRIELSSAADAVFARPRPPVIP